MHINARRYENAEPVTIDIKEGRISDIRSWEPAEPLESVPFVAPGLVDLQVNGYGGQDFNDPNLEIHDVERVSLALEGDGVTSYCPTATTHSAALLEHVMRTIGRAMHESPIVNRRAVGIHLEGPYLSPQDGPRGAHPREHIRPPDWDEFQRLQEAAHGRIVLLTMSPEYPNSAIFIRKVVESGVRVAIGHTAAGSQQIAEAVDAGATMSTHLGNGAHGQIRRHPNYIWDQLADDRLIASLIVDGHHLPPSVVKSFVRAKTPERCVLVSDITGMAGMPPGRYENSSLGAVEVLEDGRLVVAGQRQYLAGAALPLIVGVGNVMRFAGVDLKTAIDMASTRPASLVHAECGFLAIGAPADLMLFHINPDQSLTVETVINGGDLYE